MKNWKKTDTHKARLLRSNSRLVYIEIKIGHQFEERAFDLGFFAEFNLDEYRYFLVTFYQRPGAFMFEIVDGTGKVSEADFENVDLTEIKESPIFKH